MPEDVLGHRPEVALGEDGEFVGGDHVLGSGIKVAGYVTAVVAFEGLQAQPSKGGFRNIRACEKWTASVHTSHMSTPVM